MQLLKNADRVSQERPDLVTKIVWKNFQKNVYDFLPTPTPNYDPKKYE